MINKAKWAEIIKDFHQKELPSTIERDLEINLDKKIKRARSIIGPRRAGKTFEMFISIKKVIKEYGNKKVLYINFERADIVPASYTDLTNLIETYFEIYPENKKDELWLFLDEIQNVTRWEIFVRNCLDEGIKVFLSGSSSKLLSKEIATSMRGRNLSYYVYTFSFKEYLKAKNFEVKKYYSSSEKAKIANYLQEYTTFGGYPEVVLYPEERNRILTDILETAIYRDVIERNKIRNTNGMKLLINTLVNSKEFSANKFFNFTKSQGIKIGKDAIYNYIKHLNDAFFVFTLRKFSLSYKKAEQSLPKIYFIDNGLLSIKGIDDKGRLIENTVFTELLRREKDISYYQNILKEEVDFVIKEGKKVKQLIQVCYDISNFMTLHRETKVLIKASKELSCNDLLIINIDEEKEEKIDGKNVKFIPLWKWLVED